MLESLKSAIRPVITVSLVWGALGMLYLNLVIPEWYITLTVSVVSFWFGTRKVDK